MSKATKPKGPRARPGVQPERPRKLLERPWPWMILAGLIGGAIVALALSMLKTAQDDGGDAGAAFLLLAGTGLIAVVLMLLTAFYSARKRRRVLQEHLPGTMMTWLKAHVWLGLVATFAIVVHWWLYPINSRITTGKITLAILVVLVVSGIAWRIVYVTVPRGIPGKVGNLSLKDTRSRREQIEVEIEKTLAGASDELRRLADELLRGKTKVAELDGRAATLAVQEQASWQELRALAERLERYKGREPKQERYHRMLQGWKLLHLPLAVALGAAIAIHVADVLGIDNKVFAEEAQAFPDSGQCADCHSDIVREWNLAVHSVAQTSPTTVAQTALALQIDPNIGALCTNCHAPIGMQITPNDTFPLPGEGGAPVVSEGITCWTCHSVSEIPGELRGGQDDFPVGRAGDRDFGTVFGPPLGGDPPLPVPDHQTAQGFMTNELNTFQLCGSCHNVKADIEGDGFSPFGDEEADESGNDEDGDGKLDENELVEVDRDEDGIADAIDVDGSGLIEDLVLQTTFDEWEDYLANDQGGVPCATCHMLSSTGPAVDDAPGNLDLPDRTLHSHAFIGVDYDLEPGHYAGLGVGGGDATAEVLGLREGLINSGVTIQAEVRVRDVSADILPAEVTVRTGFIGHDFPTGFAFARQWWLEVSATTADGEEVCLTPIDPATKLPDPERDRVAVLVGHDREPQGGPQAVRPDRGRRSLRHRVELDRADLHAEPARRLRPVARELPEDPDRRGSRRRRNVHRGAVPVVATRHREEPDPRRRPAGDGRPEALRRPVQHEGRRRPRAHLRLSVRREPVRWTGGHGERRDAPAAPAAVLPPRARRLLPERVVVEDPAEADGGLGHPGQQQRPSPGAIVVPRELGARDARHR